MASKKEIARRTKLAVAAIQQAADDTDSVIPMFASHHLKELEPAYWKQHTGTTRPSQTQILKTLELRGHWDTEDENGVDVFDFTLPGGVTDYVIAVKFDEDGEVAYVTMES